MTPDENVIAVLEVIESFQQALIGGCREIGERTGSDIEEP
jgi:hypothetical protein